MKNMNFELDKEEFENLMKLVYWGNWMANANKLNDKIDQYESLKSKIFAKAQEVGLDEYVEKIGDTVQETEKFREKTDVNKIHDEYDEDTFWGELVDRLAMKEFTEKYSKQKIEDMSMKERIEKSEEFFEKYEQEIRNNGLDNITVSKK